MHEVEEATEAPSTWRCQPEPREPRSYAEKGLESPAALSALPGWDGNGSPGAGSQPPGSGCKPPHFSGQVFVLAQLLVFNSALNSVPFISDGNSDSSPFVPLAGTSLPGAAALQIDLPCSRALPGQVRQRS